MKGRKPEIIALQGALDKAPTATTWLPKFAKTEWARGKLGRLRRGRDRQPRIFLGQAGGGWLIALTAAAIASV